MSWITSWLTQYEPPQVTMYNKNIMKELTKFAYYVYDVECEMEKMKRSHVLEILDAHAQWKENIQ